MASVMGFCVSPISAIRSGRRNRFQVHLARSLDGRSSTVLSSGSDSVNGASLVVETQQNGSLIKEERKVELVSGEVEEKKSNEEGLAPLWDDGYGTRTVEDYFTAAKEMFKCDDGGPPRWFCPVECGCPLKDSPTLMFLPGMDGTGLGLTLHHQALGKAFEVRCLHIPVHDRTPFEGLVKLVEEAVKLEYALSPNKPIYLVGDSFGGCLALAVAARNPTVDLVLILANPATSFGRSQLQPLFPILEALPDELHVTVPFLLSFIMGDPVKMASVNIGNKLPPTKKIAQLSHNLTALLPCLPELADILPRDTLLWKLKLLKAAAAYANSRLHAVKAEVLVLASGKDNMLPSVSEAQRLVGSLQNCKVRNFKDNGHTLLLEDGIGLLTIIKGTRMYRRSRRHDLVMDFIPPSMTEFRYAMDQVVGLFRSVTGSVMFSTLEDGKIVKGLSGVPDEGPVLYVGYHMLLGFELASLTNEFLSQKGIMLRGIAHPELFTGKTESLSSEFSMVDWVKVFGAVPVSASNLFKLLSTKSHVLLYPGGAREALHFKGEEYKLIWPDHPEFVRMAARFGATIVPFGAVGEDDIAEMVLDYNDLMKIPIVNDYIREMNRESVSIRQETSGEVANTNLSIPVLLPKIPGRFYYLFGKPIRTKGVENMLKDKESANQMYLHIKSQVEHNLDYLIKKREEDPYRNLIDRKMYQGSALGWFKWLHSNQQLTTWEAFTRALELRFGPPSFENHQAALFKLRQTGTVMEYQLHFETLSNRVTGMSAELLLNCFISGLRSDIQREIAVMQPYSLHHAIGLAKLLETKILDAKPNFNRFPRAPAAATTGQPSPSILGTPPTSGSLPIRRLSPAEINDRRAKGLCYNCDDRFTPGHRCQTKKFLLMLADESSPATLDVALLDTGPSDASGSHSSELVSPETTFDSAQFQLSQAALLGPSSPRTMRIHGAIRHLSVTILVDSGSSHNIMQPRIPEFLGFSITAIPPFSVVVGNGASIQCSGITHDVPVTLSDQVFPVSFYILPIHGADLVLGVQWLQTLGPFLSDYSVPSIQFSYNNQPITLVGNTLMEPKPASYSQFCRFIFTNAIESLHSITVAPADATSTLATTPVPPCLPSDLSMLHSDIADILLRFTVVFSKPQGLPPHRAQDHHIHLFPDSTPVNVRPYRYPQCQKDIMTQMINEMLQDGIIKPSASPFSSPVLLVRKKDGTWHFCVDYRALNAITVKDRFPIPTVDELLDELHGSTVFSKLDLCSSYHQILLAPHDTFKTTFRTVDGHFEFLVMPFGLTNAPSAFQATMNDVFREFLRKFVLVFFDDILIYSLDWTSHLEHLQQVLQVLAHHQLFAKFSKCHFGLAQVEYLGHVISHNGVAADPTKLQAISDWPVPKSVTALRGFLGLSGYYRRFVRNYAAITSPLTDLLKKNKFEWNEQAQSAFHSLKDAMTSLHVLTLPEFSCIFDVTTDASGTAIGAVLSQNNHPIAFFSKKMCPRMQAASAYEREMYAITAAVKKWRHYLLGRHFRIYTDQKSLRGLFAQSIQTPAQEKWLTKLLGFDYEILYTPGRSNVVADALSRIPCEPEALFAAVSSCQPLLLEQLRNFYSKDPIGQALLTKFQQPGEPSKHFMVQHRLLHFRNRLFIPLESGLRPTLLEEYHATPASGHSGVKGTLTRLATSFSWPHMAKDVKLMVRHCQICQQNKYSNQKPSGLLQPLPVPHQIWEDISMDFITHLPPCGSKLVI